MPTAASSAPSGRTTRRKDKPKRGKKPSPFLARAKDPCLREKAGAFARTRSSIFTVSGDRATEKTTTHLRDTIFQTEQLRFETLCVSNRMAKRSEKARWGRDGGLGEGLRERLSFGKAGPLALAATEGGRRPCPLRRRKLRASTAEMRGFPSPRKKHKTSPAAGLRARGEPSEACSAPLPGLPAGAAGFPGRPRWRAAGPCCFPHPAFPPLPGAGSC